MIFSLCAALWMIMLCWPDTAIGRGVRHVTVTVPARLLSGITRRQVLFVSVMLLVMIAGAGSIAGVMSADLAMLLAWDASLYVDTLIAVGTVAAVTRGSGVCRIIRTRIAAMGRGARAGRARRTRPADAPVRRPANDDEDRPTIRRAA